MSKKSMKVCWLHLIWSTKNRYPFFKDPDKAREVIKIFKDICTQNEVYYKTGHVNSEHVHLLIDLPVKLSIEKLLQFLKGTSSHTINDINLFKAKFSWAKRYAAFSVSNSQINTIIQYINNQKEHHRKKSFLEEWQQYVEKYDLIKSP